MHGLTSLAQPMAEIGDHVLRLVSESLSGAPDARDRGGVLLHPTLVTRTSTARSQEGQ